MTFYKKDLGRYGEKLAVKFLKHRDYRIIELNFLSKFGEIDIIASKDGKIHFIEVKTRKNLQKGKPYESVNYHKKRKFLRACKFYLLKNKITTYKLSLDVISIVLDQPSPKIDFFESITQ